MLTSAKKKPNVQARTRLDSLLVERGVVDSRVRAQALIMAGEVLVDDMPIEKAGTKVLASASIRLRNEVANFVSRGGDKIDPIFKHFEIDLSNTVAVDIGASTGGFTHSMLQRGARLVYAVDVGYNQLHHRLRCDKRVVVMERVNAKDLVASDFEELPSFATIDVSFIGLRKIIKPICGILKTPFSILALVKPQFELEPSYVSKGGVVRSSENQLLAVRLVSEFAQELGLNVRGFLPSPIKGAKKGNQEFFILMESGGR
ncbi:MAG: TlyA family RNA methyltransferase [Deltaproteobacteria bacterium]|nr:TlyA family RNA methyltransferase [Deltaproteobacteria bacterium]